MQIPPPPPMLAQGPFGLPATQFIDIHDHNSGVQIGDVVLHHEDCFQMPNDEHIYKAIFHFNLAFGQTYRFQGITRRTYNQGDWGNDERITQYGFAQQMAGLRVVPCPTFNRNTAGEAASILHTLNRVSRQGTVPAIQGIPSHMQPMIESYLTGMGEGRPARETRLRIRELLTRPRPTFFGSQLYPGVGGKKRRTNARQRRAKKRSQTRRRR